MAKVVSRAEKLMQFASAAVFLFALVFSWVATDFAYTYPAIYPYPQANTGGIGLFIAVTGLALLVLGLPVALTIFSGVRVVFFFVCLVFIPIGLNAAKDIGNVLLDGEKVTRLNATVVGKRQSHGWKTKADLLQVTLVGGQQAYEFAVDYKYFLASSVGDSISLHIHPGFFGQPWVGRYSG